ncbi:delta-endotoxin CytB [Lentinula aff. lateritia]|uniref:Delta-endotoxin CytB n=1 Tax=Lentinula aff. lateritia TaxID=2804960 RepID=A0ACC1UAJ4_9AGAR|nr:delta-endotoxin CytB [Lentinula aff. lateritia]
MSDDPTTFNQFSKLPQNLVMTAMQVMQFSGHFVDLKQPKTFRWDQFLNGINNYKGMSIDCVTFSRLRLSLLVLGDDLTFDKYQNNRINQQSATVSTMVDKIVDFLCVVLSVALTEKDISALSKNIETTFTNLENARDNGWADFSMSSSSSNSSWEYQVLFAFPNPDLPDFFYSLVTTIKLEADIKEEKSWWGLVHSDRRNFAATIDAMELVVLRGFKNPLKA